MLQISEINNLLEKDGITVIGVLLALIGLLIWERYKIKIEHKEEKQYLREEIKKSQIRLDSEYKESNIEMRKVAENYHIFTTQVFERLNIILNTQK